MSGPARRRRLGFDPADPRLSIWSKSSGSDRYALLIVGITSLLGAIVYARRGLVSFHEAVYLAVPSITGVFISRHFIINLIPDTCSIFGLVSVRREHLLLVIFSVAMFTAGATMIRDIAKPEGKAVSVRRGSMTCAAATAGLLAGLLGIGGGFLIVPVLIIYGGLEMKTAVGTSLTVIAGQSLFGFGLELQSGLIAWNILLPLTCTAITGMAIGSTLSQGFRQRELKRAFGLLLMIVSLIIAFSQ